MPNSAISMPKGPSRAQKSTQPRAKTRTDLALRLGLLACLPLICIPKAGIKAGSVPLTISYFAMGIACCLIPFVKQSFKVPRPFFYCYMATIPFAIIAILQLSIFAPLQLGFAVALLVGVALIPPMFLIFLRDSIQQVFLQRSKTIRVCVVLVALFGITDFFARNFLKLPLDIPFITENGDDADKLDQKYNTRGDYTKLYSTYGNGNIYGVCMLMLGPLCFALGATRKEKAIIVLSIFLSLSRTAWVGLALWLLLWFMFYKKQSAARMLAMPVVVGCVILLAIVAALVLGVNEQFLLDPSLGGRTKSAAVSDIHWAWIGISQPFDDVSEMTYLSIFASFGFIGLLAFFLWFWFPIGKALADWKNIRTNNLAKAALISMCIYATVAFVDGAFLLIPVVPIYWIAACLSMSPSPLPSGQATSVRNSRDGARAYAFPLTS